MDKQERSTRENNNSENTCTSMFFAALFIIAGTGKQSTEEWIKMWYVYTMEYDSSIKKKEATHLQQLGYEHRDDDTSEVRKRKTDTM